MKTIEQVMEILKAGNVTYPKATFQNVYNALTFLAQRIDELKENELKLIGTAKLLAEEIDELKKNDVKHQKLIHTLFEDLNKLNQGDAIDGMSIDDVFAVTHPGDSVAFAIKNISEHGIKWGIGSRDSDGNYSMHHGPFLTKQDCLDIRGEDKQYIIQLGGNAEDILEMIWDEWEQVWVNYAKQQTDKHE